MNFFQKNKIRRTRVYGFSGSQQAAAALMTATGLITGILSGLYQAPDYSSEIRHQDETREVRESNAVFSEATASEVEHESETPQFEAAADQLNLVYFFPEDADGTDAIHSYAGQVYQKLMLKEAQYLASVYEEGDITPLQMAQRLGYPSERVLGKYNPEDSTQDPENAATWLVPHFKNVNISFYDADGNRIESCSNVKDIMAMANVYGYYHDYTDAEAFETYCMELYDKSHSCKVTMGEVYYCSGCLNKTLEEEAQEAIAEETQETMLQESLPAEEEIPAESDSKEILSFEMQALETIIPFEDLETENSSDDTEERETLGGPGVVTEEASEEVSEPEKTDLTELLTEDIQKATASEADQAALCPGHIDLYVTVQTMEFNDQNGLICIDEIGSTPDSDGGIWEGWTEERCQEVNMLIEQDWFQNYGLTISSITVGKPLTQEEISAYLARLPKEISEERRKVISFALNSVGKVPYYYGGKPASQGYEKNHFGSVVSVPDASGRILRGLDCSGWINWVYWSALGNRLSGESTGTLVGCGTKIRRSDLRPGDIIIRLGADAHVVMFLEWTENGNFIGIHETGGTVNNVTVAEMSANWPYYRSLLP